jgi:hypothetical protein
VQALSGAGVFVLLTVLAVWAVAKRRLWGFAPAWFLLALLPYSNLAVAIGTVMAERFLYLPAMGLAAGIAVMFPRDERATATPARVAFAVCLAVTAALGVAATQQARVWRSDTTLWRSAVAAYPDDRVANLAYTYYLLKEDTRGATTEAAAYWRTVRNRFRAETSPLFLTRVQWIEQKLAERRTRAPSVLRRDIGTVPADALRVMLRILLGESGPVMNLMGYSNAELQAALPATDDGSDIRGAGNVRLVPFDGRADGVRLQLHVDESGRDRVRVRAFVTRRSGGKTPKGGYEWCDLVFVRESAGWKLKEVPAGAIH